MQTKGGVTREKILSEATRLFHQKGFGATSINDLVAATGLKKGSLYFHFEGKDALALAILKKAREEFLEFLNRSLSGTTPGASLRRFFQCVFKKHKSNGFVGGCIFGNTALEMSDKEPFFANFIRGIFEEWVEKLQDVIKNAQVSGEVRNDLSAHLLARHVVSTLEGCIMMARLEKDERLFQNCLKSLEVLIGLKE
ncbi:MAG: TetR/AcrR family transcriptional regulator [Deltaproteobacteria bacterium]|nr:TetR/AcrR family transcriptional regulator [Deltaproteobacteria bacterium]